MKDIGNILIGLGVLINAILAVIMYFYTIKTSKSIDLLEQNTNSIKDALVKVTGESEYAKGLLQGKNESEKK